MTGLEDVQPLPQRSRLFHIGPYKTGTSAVQSVASQQRAALLDHGVRYPGRGRNHRAEVNAFSGRGGGWTGADGAPVSPPPPAKLWRQLKREIDAEQERRVWFGHENVAAGDDAQAARWLTELGPDTRVVITLRAFSRMLTSLWQESLKRNAGRSPLESWLRNRQRLGQEDMLHDPARIVARWVAAAGPERVTVVALDPRDPSFLFHAFERLLDLPAEMLAATGAEATPNRSLTVPEAEFLRRLNVATRDAGLEWPNHELLVFYGTIGRLQRRTPGPEEPRLRLPDWAVELASAHERRILEVIGETGVRVVGDPGNLVAPPPTQPYVNPSGISELPIDVATQALFGAIGAATGRNNDFVRSTWSIRRKLRSEVLVNAPAAVRELGGRALAANRGGSPS